MLTLDEVARIAKNAAAAALQGIEVSAVLGEPTSGSEGEDALLVTVVIPSVFETITGEAVGDVFIHIQRALGDAGEDRFPIIEFATEDELLMMDDD